MKNRVKLKGWRFSLLWAHSIMEMLTCLPEESLLLRSCGAVWETIILWYSSGLWRFFQPYLLGFCGLTEVSCLSSLSLGVRWGFAL